MQFFCERAVRAILSSAIVYAKSVLCDRLVHAILSSVKELCKQLSPLGKSSAYNSVLGERLRASLSSVKECTQVYPL